MKTKTLLIAAGLTLNFGLGTLNCIAQCPDGLVYSTPLGGNVYVYDPSLPLSASNPTTTGITGTVGNLAYGPNLNVASPSPTFYQVVGGNYQYWNGSAWVSTGHTAGDGTNIGTGGGFIYNLDITDEVYKYDGTGNATFLMTIPGIGLGTAIYDIVVDNCGNFCVLKKSSPQWLNVYNSSGTLLSSYTISGLPAVFGSGMGLSIIGTTVHAYTDAAYTGTISGSNINFVASSLAWPTNPGDYASCPVTTCFTPLPITLLTFTGSCVAQNSILCNWSTATETNNDYFTIERSADAVSWEKAGTVKGAGNSSTQKKYEFIDNSPLSSIEGPAVRYYRLSQTDYDGKTETFNSKQVAVDVTECAVQVFPNPAGNTLNVPYAAAQDGEVILEVYDVIGKLVKGKTVTVAKGHNTFTLDLTTVAQGMYILKIDDESGKKNNQKFVRQ